MLARVALKTDKDAVDVLLDYNKHGDVRLDRDILVVAGNPARGILVWRPSAFVHEFVAADRVMANALVNYAMGQARPTAKEAVFLVEPGNKSMLRYVKLLGATEQPGKIYTLGVG
jgi:hypothetical protein